MMKARVLVFAGVAAMALASCQKSVSPAENPDAGLRIESNPVELTLTATIGGPGTKVEYSDVSNVLKGTWRVGDKISLLALDDTYKVLSNDVFEAKSAGVSATFAGTYTNPVDPATEKPSVRVAVIYPALTEGAGTAASPWASKNPLSKERGVVSEVSVGKNTADLNSSFMVQEHNGDPSSLEHYTLLCGVIKDPSASISSGKVAVNLDYRSFVIKAKMKVSVMNSVTAARLVSSQSTTEYDPSPFGGQGKSYFTDFFGNCAGTSFLRIDGLGTYDAAGDKYSGIAPDSSDCITVYFVGFCNPGRAATLKSGSTITVSVSGTGSKSFARKVITPTKNISLAAGKMYRTSELVLE